MVQSEIWCEIWSLSDCKWTRTHKLQTKWLWVQVHFQSLKLQISCLFWSSSSFPATIYNVDSFRNAYVTWQEHTVGSQYSLEIYRTSVNIKNSENVVKSRYFWKLLRWRALHILWNKGWRQGSFCKNVF